jgi:hypothetical protein
MMMRLSWTPGEGRDVVVVVSLNETTLENYSIELPGPGRWHEVFNSDVYDHFPNPWVVGNGGAIYADGPAGLVYPHSGKHYDPSQWRPCIRTRINFSFGKGMILTDHVELDFRLKVASTIRLDCAEYFF